MKRKKKKDTEMPICYVLSSEGVGERSRKDDVGGKGKGEKRLPWSRFLHFLHEPPKEQRKEGTARSRVPLWREKRNCRWKGKPYSSIGPRHAC